MHGKSCHRPTLDKAQSSAVPPLGWDPAWSQFVKTSSFPEWSHTRTSLSVSSLAPIHQLLLETKWIKLIELCATKLRFIYLFRKVSYIYRRCGLDLRATVLFMLSSYNLRRTKNALVMVYLISFHNTIFTNTCIWFPIFLWYFTTNIVTLLS